VFERLQIQDELFKNSFPQLPTSSLIAINDDYPSVITTDRVGPFGVNTSASRKEKLL
jgi:hypothetical protein